MLNILKVIEYEKAVAIEYEVERGYPDTFTRTWDELLLQLPPESTRAEAVVLAALLLKQKVDEANKEVGRNNDLLALVKKAVEG